MIEVLKRIYEWIVDYIVEILMFGSLITVIVLLIFVIYFSKIIYRLIHHHIAALR